MLQNAVYPAAITPMDARGKMHPESLAKLLAWFESAGCAGAVLAGTNGEGPSLSAPEKRDLLATGFGLRGNLSLILGIATPSLEEAVWLSRRAAEVGAIATLVMPPSYFVEATEIALGDWYLTLMDKAEIPLLAYNFPKRTGITLSPVLLQRIGVHEHFAGAKDSSGNRENLTAFRAAIPDFSKRLYVGDETLLLDALEAGWSGTISGAANVVPQWLSTIVREWHAGDKISAQEKFQILLPVLQKIRQNPQPATHKALLKNWGILDSEMVRLPLSPRSGEETVSLSEFIRSVTGLFI